MARPGKDLCRAFLAADAPARTVSAEQRARREEFCRAVFCAEFAAGRRIDDTETIGAILSKLNVEPSAVLAAALSDDNKARLRAETEEAQRLGLFGAPSFSTADGELFWGNDRLEHALAWAKQHG